VFGPSLDSGRNLPHAFPGGVLRAGVIPAFFRLALPNGTFIAETGTARGQAELAAPLLLVSEDGRLIKRIGELTPEEGSNLGLSNRSVSLGKERTHFWVMRRNQYDLQRFTIEGERDLTLKVDGSPWMRDWSCASAETTYDRSFSPIFFGWHHSLRQSNIAFDAI
jgi:hypothetical protein